MISHLWSCIKGPRVYRIYAAASGDQQGQGGPYNANPLEHGSQQVLKCVNILSNIGLYVSPIIILYLWRKDYSLELSCISIAKFTAGFTLLVLVSMVIRGIGRSLNPSYNSFLIALKEADVSFVKHKPAFATLAIKYDCDFSALPVTYAVERRDNNSNDASSWMLECFTMSGMVAHLFGRHMIYPGSIKILQAAMAPYLEEGRSTMVVKHKGTRAKVLTSDGNEIDTLFVDRRSVASPQGSTLVICCEGNAGFYEVGIAITPITAGFSVLGWNMPGFAYSTGLPFSGQIEFGVDAVMQFAINSLGFTPDNVIVYGWSIGGYPAAWLASRYPEIRGLVLDATFDHLLPLALPRMPAFMSGLVVTTVKKYFNLDTAGVATQYHGPLTVVRHRADEIITVVEGDLSTNRGNELLRLVLLARYPQLFNEASEHALSRYLCAKTEKDKDKLMARHEVRSEEALTMLTSYFTSDEAAAGPTFPASLGEDNTDDTNTRLLLFLASKMLVDVNGTHSTPLEPSAFKQPWSVVADASYVQVE